MRRWFDPETFTGYLGRCLISVVVVAFVACFFVLFAIGAHALLQEIP